MYIVHYNSIDMRILRMRNVDNNMEHHRHVGVVTATNAPAIHGLCATPCVIWSNFQ